jgi:hypothetical protein
MATWLKYDEDVWEWGHDQVDNYYNGDHATAALM